jgi:hypothetical protein
MVGECIERIQTVIRLKFSSETMLVLVSIYVFILNTNKHKSYIKNAGQFHTRI